MNTATTAAPQLPPGTVIDGTYTTGALVRSRLGAATYAATDMSGSRVDVTIYAPQCFVSPVALERSLRELRQLEKVHAPQVLRILDAGKLPQGGIYEVHEASEGRSLAERGAISPAEVGPLIHEIVAGLQAAQKVGVLHRNLGAEAVLRTDRGIKLTGFAVGDPQGGVSFGSLDCIAPEQVEGKNIDERTLVYNLAALTYRFLRGASLFTGGDNGTQLLQAAASLPPPESMPGPLFAALAKDPKARPNLLSRFLADLDVIVRDFPVRSGAVTGAPDTQTSSPSMRDPDHSTDTARGGEEREVSDTLGPLMTDPDAPKLPSSGTTPAAASTPGSRPGTIPPRPAIITGPGMLGTPPPNAPKPATPSLGAPPSLGGGLPNAPSLGSLPNLGKPAAPAIGAPPGLGKPGLPNMGAPNMGAPNLGAPNIGAPNLGAPNMGAPNMGAPNMGAPNLSPPTFGAPPVGAPSVAPPSVAAPSVAPPSAAPASASASANAAAKPRTRGWTMFMEVTEDESGASSTAGVPLPGAPPSSAGGGAPLSSPQVGPPVGAPVGAAFTAPIPGPAAGLAPTPTPAVAPAGPTGEVKPSTRGWTMIMDEPTDADPAAIGLSTPAAAASPPPPSPTTRGWTMLEELNDSVPVPVPGAAPAAVAPAAAAPVDAAPAGGAPSSRGWTMFMEAELQGGGTKPEEPEAEPEFYDGTVQTDSGTVVAFAPTAADPNAGARARVEATPDLGSQEPMTSFGARLRGTDDAGPSAPSLSPESAPSPSAEIPSFAGNNLGFAVAPPATPAAAQTPATRVEPQPDAVDHDADLDAPAGGNTKLVVIGVIVFVIIVVVVIMAMS